ncbi:MAG: PadR family transcriptional regulator [Candidatus Bathyarchaeia archaeon]
MAYERLIRKLTKENLWIYVLSLLNEGPKYGYEIRDEIREKFNFEPGKVTSYVVLYKLQKEGYIALEKKKRSGEGPERKYYVITEEGKKLLTRAEEFLKESCSRIFKKQNRQPHQLH